MDKRVELVLQGLDFQPTRHNAALEQPGQTLGQVITSSLVWSETLNAAIVPAATSNGLPGMRMLVAHSTMQHREVIDPDTSFGVRPEGFQTPRGNVYGTGLYTANRPEATVRLQEQEEDREIGAYLSGVFTMEQVEDRRRRFVKDVLHLVGMTAREKLYPSKLYPFFGDARDVAKIFADQQNEQYDRDGKTVILLNEAPRNRLQKMRHEKAWRYDVVSPQAMLLRMPGILLVGKYQRPEELPKRYNPLQTYGALFWEAAWRNGRDMRPHIDRFGKASRVYGSAAVASSIAL